MGFNGKATGQVPLSLGSTSRDGCLDLNVQCVNVTCHGHRSFKFHISGEPLLSNLPLVKRIQKSFEYVS